MSFEFDSVTIEWRGPAPFVFAPVPEDISAEIKSMSQRLTYGWGVIPAKVRIGKTTYSTSLFPRQGIYLVPIKVAVQKAESVGIDELISLQIELGPER